MTALRPPHRFLFDFVARITLSVVAFALLFCSEAPSLAQAVQNREQAVLDDRASLQDDPRWIYNDVDKAFAEAERQNKPLLITVRCIPCHSCAGIDAQVLMEDGGLPPLLDQFVCLRLINANDLDLSRFQFDFDLSFSTLFFNAGGTLYGRFGSWTHQKDPENKEVDGFKAALESVLGLHKRFPANKKALAGKQAPPLPFKSPTEIPALSDRYTRQLDWTGNVVKSCIHCHQVGDAIRSFYRDDAKPVPVEWIFPYPAPETIGLNMAQDRVAHVASVESGSLADRSGIRAGDHIASIEGQPLVSIADISWILHQAGNDATNLTAQVARDGHDGLQTVSIALPKGWREHADISRRVGTWQMRAMAAGGLKLNDLDNAERERLGLGKDSMALFVEHAGRYGKHRAARDAGFLDDDIIVRLDENAHRATESEVIGKLMMTKKPGDRVPAVVLRDGKKLEFMLPIQ